VLGAGLFILAMLRGGRKGNCEQGAVTDRKSKERIGKIRIRPRKFANPGPTSFSFSLLLRGCPLRSTFWLAVFHLPSSACISRSRLSSRKVKEVVLLMLDDSGSLRLR
jgi:hypothetical protein